MKILILGYSNIVQKRVLPALKKIAAIEKIDIASRKNIPSIPGVMLFHDYEEALKQTEASVVYISLINSDHGVWARKALEFGKHVIVDKPAFTDPGLYIELMQLATDKKLCLTEALVYEYHSQISRIKELARNASRISVEFSFPPLNPQDFRYAPASGGGALFDLGPYAVSVGRIFFGTSPIEVIGRILKQEEVETAFSVLMVYPESKSIVGLFGFDTQYKNNISLSGPDCALRVDRIFTTTPDLKPRLMLPSGMEELEPEDSFVTYLQFVMNGIKNNNFENLKHNLIEDAKALHALRDSCRRPI